MRSLSRTIRLLLTFTLLVTMVASAFPPPASAAAAHPLASTAALNAPAAATGPSWVFQGPAPQLNAQQDTANVSAAQEAVSGAVTAIAPSPTNPDLVYIGAANGGIWKTTNATAATPTWTPLTDNLPSQSIGIGALAFDPTDSSGDTLVAGTGRFSGYGNSGDDQVGIYYSTDGGSTWTVSSGTNRNLVTFSNNPVNVTGVAARGSTLLVATSFGSGYTSLGGLFRTTTGPSGTWTQISGTGGLPNAAANFVVGDPANPNVLYVGFLGASGGIFKTSDLGASWSNVSSGINVFSSSTSALKAAVYNDGTTSVLTVVLNGANGNAIFRSVNGAAFSPLDVPSIFDNAYGTYGVAADKSNPNLVYVSGGYILPGSGPFLASTTRVDASKPSGSQLTMLYGGVSTKLAAAATSTATSLSVASTSGMPTTYPFDITIDSEQLSVTARTGTTLTVTRGANGTTAAAHSSGAVVIGYPTYGAPHVDVNYLAVDAGGALLMGTHGSLFRLPAPASPPSASNTWAARNGNLGVSEIHDIAYDHNSNTLIAGLQDNCVIYQNAPGSMDWSVGPAVGDGGDVAVADLVLPSGTPASTTMLFAEDSTWSELYVASADGFPTSGPFYLTADNEEMFVSAIKGAAYTIATATQSGNTVTITTAAPHGLAAGNGINVRGVSDSRYNTAFGYVASVLSSTTFTYNLTSYANLPAATGGIASNLRFAVIRGVNGTTPATHSGAVTSLFRADLLAQPLTVRYGSSQSLGSFKRQIYTPANTRLTSTDISSSIITDKQFTHPIAVNAADPRRLLLGGSQNLYESLNMGDTIANIAQVGVNSMPGPMAYGGYRNGVANPDVLYVGSGSKVYTRTAAGGAVMATATLPAGASTIRRVAMNPTDWMNVFATDDNQVFASSDGGASWSDITGSLVSSGLSSTELNGLTVVSGPSPYLAVGSRSGVFASQLSNLGVWTKLGAGLPDVLVFELAYDATDDVLVAGTLGRSAWLLPGASAAFTPSSVAPVLSAISGPTSANEGTTQTYSFSVSDPGDRFSVTSLAVTNAASGSQAAQLVANSLTTTASGGSFKLNFLDGPASATISLQVTDSTGLTSNTVTLTVSAVNVAPTATILGAPTSGSPGTPITLSSSVTDPSAADATGPFTYLWFVYKPASAAAIANGTGPTYTYTPSIAGTYTVYLNTTDKDGSMRQTSKVITAASPDLTEQELTLSVFEGQPAINSGTFQNVNGNPLTLSASVGTLTRTDNPEEIFSDTFDSDPIGYTATSLDKWSVTQGNVDVLGPGLDNFYPGNGHYVETDGTTDATIQTKTALDLAPGTYQLSFQIGNNPHGSGNGLHVTLGSALDTSVAADNALTSVVRQFTVESTVVAPLVFAETGPSDAQGSILDNVRLIRLSPLSGTWSWSYDTSDGPAQSQNVTITATDDVNGEVTELSFPLTVVNSDPTAIFGNGGPVSEGSAGSVAFSNQSDASAADTTAGFHYAYDFDNDGAFEIGDGTYAGSPADAQATVPAGFLVEGPSTQTIRGRIIDKDGGYSDYTTDITVNNAAPTASVDGPADLLVGQVGSFVLKASDPSAADQAAGLTYSVEWGDGKTETIGPVIGNGDITARHAYAAAGGYSIQVTATDRDGATSAPATAGVQVAELNSASLQALAATTAVIDLQPASDAALHDEVAAINGMAAPASPVLITIILGAGPYSGVTLDPPTGITLDLAGNYTAGSAEGATLIGSDSGPAVTVAGGEVFVQGNGLATYADAPTVLVTDGHLTLGQSSVQESTNFNSVAVKVAGGSANLGFDMVMNVNGEGGFVSSYTRKALTPHPEGIDAELSPNLFAKDGTAVHAAYMTSTSLASSATPAIFGHAVSFTATVDANVAEHGPVTGSVAFYDGATLLGVSAVSKVGGKFVATLSTSALLPGTHTIMAVYGGDEAYIASTTTLNQDVTNQPPVATNDSYRTGKNTALTVNAPGVLGNDSDADGNPLTAAKVSDPAHGTLTLNANGSFTYTPATGYSGADSFTYKASDGAADSNVATVTITVNAPPVAANESYNAVANTTLTVTAPGVLNNDSDADHDPLTAVKVSNPAHGTLTLNANGSFTYTPASGYVGSDSFTYKANDGANDSNVATVNITVTYAFTGFFQPVDNAPTLNQVNGGQGIPIKFSLNGNFGLGILAAGSPTSQQITCSSSAPVDAIETTTTSNSGLTYDAASGQYTYVWKTQKSWAGTCRQFNLRLADGTTYTALFKFK